MPGRKRFDRSVNAVTLTATIRMSSSWDRSANAPTPPKPALLTSTSIVVSPSACSIRSPAAASDRSAVTTVLLAPYRSFSSSASSFSVASRRATRTRSCPSRARIRTSSRPIPADAPVTRAVGLPVMASAWHKGQQQPYARSVSEDPRRQVPRTDAVLADPRLVAAAERLGRQTVKAAVVAAQEAARSGAISASRVADTAVASLPGQSGGLRAVINATGVVLHTNLGRAPLSLAAVDALTAAAGYVDVEYDVTRGERSRRGRTAFDALAAAVPDAEAVHVVNNGAAALALAATALAAD